MKILLTNDDGVAASGILAAKEAVSEFGETFVVAPANQKSGIGHALSINEPLRLNQIKLRDNSDAYSVSGTPTDAVTLGIYEVMNELPDLVISGINIGHNLGKGELTTSGTVSAAMEAASLGIPSIAVSQDILNTKIRFDEGHIDVDFSPTQKVLKGVVEKIIDKGLPNGIDLLNLNVPSFPDSLEPIVVGLCDRMYNSSIEKLIDPRGKPYYWIVSSEYPKYSEDSDWYYLHEKNIPTLTPLTLDMSYNLNKLKNW